LTKTIQADSRSPFIRNFLISQNHINMNLAVKFNLLKNTEPHYSCYTPEVVWKMIIKNYILIEQF
jgi:hypothetical protein